MCNFCDIQNAAPINIFSDEEIERIVIGVYSGLITPQSLDIATYTKVAEKLTNGVYNGFGKSLLDVEWNSPDYKMLNDLRNNVYVFSGAKQYHQVREMTDAIYDGNRVKLFSEYKKTGTEIFKNYNENYLRAEYNAAISQSRSASMWMEIESNSELLPMLTYSTVGDGRVRPEHAMLNNISRPVNDKFWDSYFPPNGWNCRCTTLQTDDTTKTSLKGFKQPDTVPPEFMMNAGKQKIVFSDKHPYFVVADRDKDLASNNFYMPKPKQEIGKLPEPVKVEEYNVKQLVRGNKADFGTLDESTTNIVKKTLSDAYKKDNVKFYEVNFKPEINAFASFEKEKLVLHKQILMSDDNLFSIIRKQNADVFLGKKKYYNSAVEVISNTLDRTDVNYKAKSVKLLKELSIKHEINHLKENILKDASLGGYGEEYKKEAKSFMDKWKNEVKKVNRVNGEWHPSEYVKQFVNHETTKSEWFAESKLLFDHNPDLIKNDKIKKLLFDFDSIFSKVSKNINNND